jgi:hypothetical protein
MYIVVIGWAYVILMVAATSSSVFKALGILIGLGVFPIALFIYIVGAPQRRLRRARQMADKQDPANTQSDQ